MIRANLLSRPTEESDINPRGSGWAVNANAMREAGSVSGVPTSKARSFDGSRGGRDEYYVVMRQHCDGVHGLHVRGLFGLVFGLLLLGLVRV